MSSIHKQKALQLFCDGYNCAQAVIGAFAEEMDMQEEQVLALSSGLGGGIAGCKKTCGAELGAILVIGKICFDPKQSESKHEVAKISRQFMEQFQKRNDDSDQCAFLKERPTLMQETANLEEARGFPQMPPCAKYVIDCVELLEILAESMS